MEPTQPSHRISCLGCYFIQSKNK
uniref:Uncharacterized protein n=1 Tax=Anguilla anguilla TaxID=7936 RepID=A0A0E9U6G0_ANGAN